MLPSPLRCGDVTVSPHQYCEAEICSPRSQNRDLRRPKFASLTAESCGHVIRWSSKRIENVPVVDFSAKHFFPPEFSHNIL